MEFTEVRRVGVGNVEVAYREVGAGSPLLLVHGWPLSSVTWRKVAPSLAVSHRCVAVDLLGAGGTVAPRGEALPIDRQAEIVVGVADALGLERFALCGHDSGGSVARAAAVSAPERVTHLVLADTEIPGHRPWQLIAFQRLARMPGAGAMLRRTFASRWLARSPIGFGSAFADLSRFDFDEFHATVLRPLAESPEILAGSRRFLADFDLDDVDRLRDRYDALRMPTLLVWGEQDRFFPVTRGEALARMLPNVVAFERVPDAGLLVHEERPDVWARLVGEFLEPGTRLTAVRG